MSVAETFVYQRFRDENQEFEEENEITRSMWGSRLWSRHFVLIDENVVGGHNHGIPLESHEIR